MLANRSCRKAGVVVAATATCTFVLLTLSPALAAAGNEDETRPTYYADVLPILQENCQTCHRSEGENIGGMIAPMSFSSYEEVRPWAKSIARAVKTRYMPPWFATDATRGQFHHERVLDEKAIATIVRWAGAGAAAGSPEDALPPKRFVEEGSGGWSLGKPDLVVPMPERYWVEDDIADINIDFHTLIPAEQLPEDVWVQGIEFRVGGRSVHHMCAALTPPGSGGPLGKFSQNSLGCIALGAESQMFPEGYGMRLPAGSKLSFSMHYHKEPGEGSGFWDRSEIGFFFNKAPVDHPVQYDPIGNLTFEIPPGQKRWKIGAGRVFPVDVELMALWPHAHLRAVAARYDAFYPDGRHELLLDVPNYDQEWQTTYQYIEPKKLPAGTRVEVTMWFDNTEERAAERGFDAGDGVVLGTATTDEMMLGFINYAPAVPLGPTGLPLPSATGGGGE